MPNRFIDTEFFKRPFVRGLEAPLKTLYTFIICDCDNAGIWSPDFEIASIYIGQKVDKKAVEVAFKNKIIQLKNGQWFFPDFIEHQYPKGLQDTNPAHNKIIKRLTDLNLIDENLKVHSRPSNGSKVIVEDKVEVKGIVKIKRFVAPSLQDIKEFLTSEYQDFSEADKIFNFYTSNGWKVGKNPMKDWRASVRGWIGRNKSTKKGQSAQDRAHVERGGLVLPEQP